MLMSKNVNNDVSKDSPIKSYSNWKVSYFKAEKHCQNSEGKRKAIFVTN